MRERVQDNEQEGEFFRKNKEFLGVSDAGNVREDRILMGFTWLVFFLAFFCLK